MSDDPLLSQQEAAAHAAVATRTFRDWRIRPADHDGRKPLYRVSDIDGEVARRRRRPGAEQHNPLRALVEGFATDAVWFIGVHWREWFEQGAWRAVGLSEAQARDLTVRGFVLSALAVTSFKTDKAEVRIGCDLDELAERFFGRSYVSAWASEDIDVPPMIAELMPAGDAL